MALAGCFGLSSCIGKFALTQKMLAWNKTVGSKFVNELVFFAFWVLPVYEVSALADLLVLNSIEFWSGSNPITEVPAQRTVKSGDHTYIIDADLHGYTITDRDTHEAVRLDFVEEESTWNVTVGDTTWPLMTWIDDTHVALPGPHGRSVVVPVTDEGLALYAVEAGAPMAMR